MISALTQLGIEETLSADVISGCEKLLYKLMSTKVDAAITADERRWKKFKNAVCYYIS